MKTRIFVAKKKGFQVEGESLLKELKSNLKENGLIGTQVYNIYDVFNCDEADVELLKTKILSEPVTDDVYEDLDLKNKNYIAYEFLPGQYDQRADSAEQCLMLLNSKEGVVIKSGRLVLLEGDVESLEKVKSYLINPIEMREKDLESLEYSEDIQIEPVRIYEGFRDMERNQLERFLNDHGLAMTIEDLIHIQSYFRDEERRDPSETEVRVLDTYWSDHCRHTTFETYLTDVVIEGGELQESLQNSYERYLELRNYVHGNKKPMTLMDMATLGAKSIKKDGNLEDMEITEEINACSVEIDVDVDGNLERWLLMFKNETHNHPTEIEPFGGASTCIGGAIRDPLSGRSYVYQAMRVTGAADICEPLENTLANKLPQERISKGAAHGYSSYGNQIGLATTFVKEIYHPGYKAKRMEVGAVVGAVKKEYVRREAPIPGDIVVLLGGKTGRDGVGGATGSSKEHNEDSLTKCSSEVQKGNAPVERRIQRLFRNPEATLMIKKSNDFGAGGVSVAIGEIARGVEIDLDRVPVKYSGLSGTELAISESQERMAVVIAPYDLERFARLAHEENLETCVAAVVTEDDRLKMTFRGEILVDISREFLDTNGVRQHQNIKIGDVQGENPFTRRIDAEDVLGGMNTASQRGMVEMFDATIGRSTVLMPYGGRYQLTESEASVQKLPTSGFTNTCSILTFGFNPDISAYSPYLGASYAVVESLAKIVAVGGDYKKARLSFQEYFERMGKDELRWGKPFAALLGALDAQREFNTPAIGGKDSMSGTFKDIDVPPTLISFAVAPEHTDNIISPEFKDIGNYIYLVRSEPNADYTPNYGQIKKNFQSIMEGIREKKIISASVVKFGGAMEALHKMSFGNRIGYEVEESEELYRILPGAVVVESKEELNFGTLLGKTVSVSEGIDERIAEWEKRYKKIYPYMVEFDGEVHHPIESLGAPVKAKKLYDRPKVLICVFPGTNSEYDTKKAFGRAGAEVEVFVFNNLSVENIKNSIQSMADKIKSSQIIMFPGGFSAGDEPDGSGKFIANILQNHIVKGALKEFLGNEGLILGICNGFQALVKSGLLPNGDVDSVTHESPTLFRNDINRHISRMVETRIASIKSPWVSSFEVGQTHMIPISHGEGKFVVSKERAEELFANGQIVTQYSEGHNLNGSTYSIEGMVSQCGQIFGKMGHSERAEEGLYKNIPGDKMQDIFTNGVNYFKRGL